MTQEVEPTGFTMLGKDRFRVVGIVLASAYVLFALLLATAIVSSLSEVEPSTLLVFSALFVCFLFSAIGVFRNRPWGFVLMTLAPAGAIFVALFRLIQVYSVSGAFDTGSALLILPINCPFLVASLYLSLRRMRATHRETPPKAPGSVKKQETQVDVRYVEYLATLEEMKTAGRITEETYRKLKDEYWKRFAERDT